MAFRISGKNLDVGDALRDRINDRIAEAMGKYFDGGYSGHVTWRGTASGFAPNAPSISIPKITLHAEGMAPDAYASADQAAVRIEKRLRRYHRRLKDHRPERGNATAGPRSMPQAISSRRPNMTDEAESDGFTPVIIAESTTTLKQLSVSDAVTELDMTGAPGSGVPARRAWRHQHRLSPCRRSFRLDRSAGAGAGGCPLTPLRALPMVRRLSSMIPKTGTGFRERSCSDAKVKSISAEPSQTLSSFALRLLLRFHSCRSPISSRRTRSSRRSRSTARSRCCMSLRRAPPCSADRTSGRFSKS